MKTPFRMLLISLLLAATAANGQTSALVRQYWPMHHGDTKYYNGPIGRVYTEFDVDDFEEQFRLNLYEYDDDTGYYDWSGYGLFGYFGNTLLEYGARFGWTRATWDPPLPVLDDDLLSSCGSRTFTPVARVTVWMCRRALRSR